MQVPLLHSCGHFLLPSTSWVSVVLTAPRRRSQSMPPHLDTNCELKCQPGCFCEPRGLSRNITPACSSGLSSLIRSSLFQCRQPELNFSSSPCFFACLELPMNSPTTELDSSHLWLWMGLEGVGGQRVAKIQSRAIDTGWVETAEWGVTWSMESSSLCVFCCLFPWLFSHLWRLLMFPRGHKNISFFHPNHLKQKWGKP